jgi:hypothetical protein
MSLWSRIANVFRGDHLSREIDEEIQSHIEEAVEQGRDPAEARRAFGSVLLRREESRDIRLVAWLDSLRADAIFGWRQLMKKKVTSAAAVLSLALGIGACTAAFRIVDGLLLRPLPITAPERLYSCFHQSFLSEGRPMTLDGYEYPMFRQMRAAVKDQAELIAVSHAQRTDLTYGSDQQMEKAYRQYVSGWMFSAFGLRPALGRLLTENDDLTPGAHPYAVLSYDYWTRRFGQDPRVLGRTLRMGERLYEIVGVSDERFTGIEPGTVIDIFVPTMMNPAVTQADMAVTPARPPFGDRFAIIGDAVGARLNKDGLFSAHVTASRLAQTVLHDGIDRQALAKGYGKAIKWLAADNRFGRMVFGLSRVAFTKPVVSRITYQAYATECKVRDERSRPLSAVLWKISSGTADYREVLREMCGYSVLRSILAGAVVTLRNVAFEALFGLKWGEYGRYPTVVLKEKREVLREQLASSLGMELGESPEFERMYVIKIRGAAEEIIDELAQFGDPNARFLNLRLVEVRRIEGLPNQAGSVIRYRIPLVGLGAELRLTRRIGFETLLYQLDERLADHGKLIFNVAPARDGNSRLSIYAAFDYKKGKGLADRVLWKGAKLLFPEFVHDIVWNHALCTIKEEVERKHCSSPAFRSG